VQWRFLISGITQCYEEPGLPTTIPFYKTHVNQNHEPMKYSFPDVPAHLINANNEIPAPYKGYQYPFAKSLLSSTPLAVILEQKTTIRNYTLSHHWIFVKGPVKLRLSSEEKGAILFCMLQGSVDCRINGARPQRLYQGQYNLLQLRNATHEVQLNPGLYASCETSIPVQRFFEQCKLPPRRTEDHRY